ncbi:hypothetical protein [Lysinibacillus fusiformis]|uniref:hypothetical protein n=1 Tax=Lysinibacillus fusiformis TaxID=28031 RepID=UPI00215B532E|nr:hypothetical protein [Lysinibacillus fusiformis]MCR8853632.1 hypothetical protein [Lysinibacillus fusiformis]
MGTTNNSVLFSETVHMQLAGWSDGLIMVQNEFRLDEIVPLITLILKWTSIQLLVKLASNLVFNKVIVQ